MDAAIQSLGYTHDAFICYSRKSIIFARKLEEALESYKPPNDLKVAHRNPNVFLDTSDITGTEYFQSIDRVWPGKSNTPCSGGRPVVVVQHSAQTLLPLNPTGVSEVTWFGAEELVTETLVRAFLVVM